MSKTERALVIQNLEGAWSTLEELRKTRQLDTMNSAAFRASCNVAKSRIDHILNELEIEEYEEREGVPA